jgi:hypothetical protein
MKRTKKQAKAPPTPPTPAADFTWTETEDEADWIKTLRWDLPRDFRQLIQTIAPTPDLRSQKAALTKLMNLPAWQAAPRMIQNQAAKFLASDTPIE